LDFFDKRAANLIRRHKIANCHVKIGLWILTTNFTKTAIEKDHNPNAYRREPMLKRKAPLIN